MLAPFETQLDGCHQGLADAILDHHAPGINQLDERQRRLRIGPLAQRDHSVALALGIGPGFQRGRRRAQQNGNAELMGAKDRDIARRIAHAVLLLEGGIMFLIDHNQAEARHRREHR